MLVEGASVTLTIGGLRVTIQWSHRPILLKAAFHIKDKTIFFPFPYFSSFSGLCFGLSGRGKRQSKHLNCKSHEKQALFVPTKQFGMNDVEQLGKKRAPQFSWHTKHTFAFGKKQWDGALRAIATEYVRQRNISLSVRRGGQIRELSWNFRTDRMREASQPTRPSPCEQQRLCVVCVKAVPLLVCVILL